MCCRSFELLFLLVMLMLGKPGTYGIEEAQNCTITVNVERNTQYRLKSGNAAIIKCPVIYCQNKPEIKWYKKIDNSSLLLHSEQRHTFTWIADNVFVLNFSSVHQNDSGLYRCESISGIQKDTSHYINVTVQDNITDRADETDKAWIIYLLSSLGVLCVIAVICWGPLYFMWKNPVKNKKISSGSQSEMNVINSGEKYYSDNPIGTPDEGSVLHHDAATPGLKCKHGSTICDNQVSCWKSFRAATNRVYHQSVTNSHNLPGEDKEIIVYASLSHGEHSQRIQPSVEIELTEYATVRQNN
ncbi:B- and T-lymphocyte attenuator [Paroedura picta]|uniref:B- and T-lymphocyte attenuator n=1 Tax=Paroedura picta TaxID=143630 RepID=UPI0040560E70